MMPDQVSFPRSFIVGILTIILAGSIGFYAGNQVGTAGITLKQIYTYLMPFSVEESSSSKHRPSGAPPGQWIHQPKTKQNLSNKQKKQIEKLKGIGYFSGTKEANSSQGTLIHNPSRIEPGYNLYVSGHGPEARLITTEGQIVHSWRYPWEKAFPNVPIQRPSGTRTRWRKVYLYPNGDLLAIFEGQGLIKIDRNSNLIWARLNQAHHDMWVSKEGLIYVLTRKAHLNRKYHKKRPILEDYISVLSPEGNTIRRISILEAFMESRFDESLQNAPRHGDITHTNTLEIITKENQTGRYPFVEGHALITTRVPDVTALINLSTGKVIWSIKGFFKAQHDTRLLPDGRLLMFDNKGFKGYSKVIEFDPFTQEIKWKYSGNPPKSFYTECCGTAQRLSNGNTLITVTEQGYAFEVTREHEIVWEFFSPHRAGDKNQLVAALYEMKRISPQYLSSWVDNKVHSQSRATADS